MNNHKIIKYIYNMEKQIKQILRKKTCNLFANEWYDQTSFEINSLIGNKKQLKFEPNIRYCLTKAYLENGDYSISKKMFTIQIQKYSIENGYKFEFNRTHNSRGFILKS